MEVVGGLDILGDECPRCLNAHLDIDTHLIDCSLQLIEFLHPGHGFLCQVFILD